MNFVAFLPGGSTFMRVLCLVCLLLASLTYGQTPPPPAPAPATSTDAPSSAPAPEQAPEMKVAPGDTVITLKGFCSDTTLQSDACKTAITRAQFEKLAEALQPKMSPVIRRNLANAYARMLRMSTAAEKRGLDKQPKFEEMMLFARMQLLAQELSRSLQDDASKISDADIEDYYNKNVGSYEQATLARIFVPRAKQLVTPVASKTPTKVGAKAGTTETAKAAPVAPTEAQKKASEEAMKKIAESLQVRAAKGEDPDKLQKEAYAAAGLPGNAPSTKMEKVRRTTLPANHHQVMDLKPGEVSELIVDTNSGFYIYKMITKETQPMDAVKPDIRNQITSQRYRDSMQGYQGNVDLNDAYFGPAKNPAMPPHPKGITPPPTPDSDDND
jgi:bifunctional DNA-binding transcriptional regulator/antitoxin component of YhaV-PrlF toxin-antitoxin module